MLQFSGSFITTIKGSGISDPPTTCIGDTVDCYRNLNMPGFFSLRQRSGENRGRVTGYSPCVILKKPKPVVSEKGRARVIREQRKHVHAFIRGELIGFGDMSASALKARANRVITYRPYEFDAFFCINSGHLIHAISEPYAVLLGSNVYLLDVLPPQK